MGDPERLARAEELIMRLQDDHEQLDRAVRAQADTLDRLQERIDRLEHRIGQLGARECGEDDA